MKIFDVCKDLALNKGRRVRNFDMTLHAIYNDPFGCDIKIDYSKIGILEAMSVYSGGREVFYYHDGGQHEAEGWYTISGEWEELIEDIHDGKLRDMGIENQDRLLASCKTEAQANKNLLETYREKCLDLINQSESPIRVIENKQRKTIVRINDDLFVELQENKILCVVYIYYLNELVFWYRWCKGGHKFYDSGRLTYGGWTNFL